MKHVVPVLLITLLAVGVAGCKKEEQERAITIHSMVGEVMIMTNNTEKPAAVGEVLITGDGIRTGADSIADILYGSEGIIRIQPESTVLLASLMDPATGDTRIDMPQGKIYVTLAKLKKGDFSVKTPTAVASVRGTSFRITADEKASRLDVVSGAVRVNPVQNNVMVASVEKTVETNQTMKMDEKSAKQAVEKKEIVVTEMKPEEIKEIRDEVKSIKPEMLEKLNDAARKEVKDKVFAPDDSAEREKREKEEKEKQEKEKMEKDQAMKLLRAKQLREEKLKKEKLLQEKQAGDKQNKTNKPKDGSGTAPAGIYTF